MKLGVLLFPQPGRSAQLAQMVKGFGFDTLMFEDTQNLKTEL